MRVRPANVRAATRPHREEWIGLVVHPRRHRLLELAIRSPRDFGEQRPLVGEVPVHRRLADTEPCCDRAQRQSSMADRLDCLPGALDQRFLEVTMVERAGPLGLRPDPLAFCPDDHVISDNMVATGSKLPDTVPLVLEFKMTGERFEFQTSAKTGDGVFRFRWSLAGGKKGPPEHIHETESETFAVVSGTLRIWLDGVPQDVGPGEAVTVRAGVRHRFHNRGTETVVVDVSLDGPLQEDVLVPLAHHIVGRKMKLSDVFVMIVHAAEIQASTPPSRPARAAMNAMAGLFRLFGARSLPRSGAW